jgi:hypothetical protein
VTSGVLEFSDVVLDVFEDVDVENAVEPGVRVEDLHVSDEHSSRNRRWRVAERGIETTGKLGGRLETEPAFLSAVAELQCGPAQTCADLENVASDVALQA